MNDETRVERIAHEATVADLRAQIAQFALLCNNVPAAIAYYERFGNTCRYANRGYAEMFGQTEASIIGLTVGQVIGGRLGEPGGGPVKPYMEPRLPWSTASTSMCPAPMT